MADLRLLFELAARYQADLTTRELWLYWLPLTLVLSGAALWSSPGGWSARRAPRWLQGSDRRARWVRVAVTCGATLYGLWAAYQLMWVGDDAFISFRYAKNLIEGHGLVYNPGERVEGYTNFLWTVLIAAAMAAGADPVTASIVLSLGALATLVPLVAWLSVRTAPSGTRVAVPVAAIVTAGCYLIANFGTSGLETMFAATLGVGALVLASQGRWIGASTAGCAAAMSHPDHILLWGSLLLALLTEPGLLRTPLQWVKDPARRRTLLRFLAPFFLLFVPYFVARWVYYGELFPNTYYAKSGGLAYFEQGGRYVLITFFAGGLFLALPLAIAGALRRTRMLAGRYFLIVVPLFTLYVAKVGGDFMLGRLFVSLLPLVFVFAEAACRDLFAAPRTWVRSLGVLAMAGLLLPAIPVRVIADGEKYWHVSDERSFYPLSKPSLDGLRSHYRHRANDLQRHVLRHDIDPLLGAGNVGVVGFLSGVRIVDILALVDRSVAHMPIKTRSRPGHEKIARGPYLLERQVDLSDDPIFPNPYSRLSEIRVGRSLFYMSGYKPDLIERWKRDPAVRHMDFARHLDRYARSRSRGAEGRLDCDLWFFDTFYFQHNDDDARARAVAARAASLRPDLREVRSLLLPSRPPPGLVPEAVFGFEDLDGWEAHGSSFEDAPTRSIVPDQGFVFGEEGAYANSYAVEVGDGATGRLRSPPFRIEGDAITLQVGGGARGVHVALLVDGELTHRASGCDTEILGRRVWNTSSLRGRTARLEVRDASESAWGHILVDEVTQWRPRP